MGVLMSETKLNGAGAAAPALSYSDLFVDADKRQNGDWVPVPGFPTAKIRVKSWASTVAQSASARLMEQRPQHLIEGTDQFDAAQKIDKAAHREDLMARTRYERREVLKELVLDWDGFAGIPFSQKNLAKVCEDENAAPFRDILFSASLSVGKLTDDGGGERLKNFVAGLGISFDSPESTPIRSTT